MKIPLALPGKGIIAKLGNVPIYDIFSSGMLCKQRKKSISYEEDKKNQSDYKPAPFSYRHLRIDERRKGNGFDQTGKKI